MCSFCAPFIPAGKSEESRLLDAQYEALLREDKHISCFFLERPQDGAAPAVGAVAAAAFALGGGGVPRSGSSLTAGRPPSNKDLGSFVLGASRPDPSASLYGEGSTAEGSGHVTLQVSPFSEAESGTAAQAGGSAGVQIGEGAPEQLPGAPEAIVVDDAALDAFLDGLGSREEDDGRALLPRPLSHMPAEIGSGSVDGWEGRSKSVFATAATEAHAVTGRDSKDVRQAGRSSGGGGGGQESENLPWDFVSRALKAPPSIVEQTSAGDGGGTKLRRMRTFTHHQGVVIQVCVCLAGQREAEGTLEALLSARDTWAGFYCFDPILHLSSIKTCHIPRVSLPA